MILSYFSTKFEKLINFTYFLFYVNITSASGSGGMNLTHDTLASMGGIVLLVNMFLGGLFGLGPTVKF